MTQKTRIGRCWPFARTVTSPAAPRTAKTSSQTGFSLVELLLTISIIAILTLIANPYYVFLRDKAKGARCAEDIRALEREISAYALEKGSLPETLEDLKRGAPRDPWGNVYQYRTAANAGADRRTFLGLDDPLSEDFDLYSMGTNGISTPAINTPASDDDIVRASGFVGPVYELNDF